MPATRRFCPICAKRYDEIHLSKQACRRHQGWLVTECQTCGHIRLSPYRGLCLECFERSSALTFSAGPDAVIAPAWPLTDGRAGERGYIRWTAMDEMGELQPPSYPGDAGFDMLVSHDTLLPGNQHTLVPCGIRVALPDGVSAVVLARSSTVKRNLLVFTTLIDSGYRGDLFVFTFNLNPFDIQIEAGDRIAQLLPVLTISTALHLKRVQPDELPDSPRGLAGFGSSGR